MTVICGKQQASFLVFCSFRFSPPTAPSCSPPDWKYHKPLNVTPSGSGEKQGRELDTAGVML